MGQLISFSRPAGITDVRPIQPEVVATLLLAMEDAPLYRAVAFPVRDMAGVVSIGVKVDGRTVRLSPSEARLAAAALVAEQAFVGCWADARTLRDAADAADRLIMRRDCGRAFTGARR